VYRMAKIKEEKDQDGTDSIKASLNISIQKRFGGFIVSQCRTGDIRVHGPELFHKRSLRFQFPDVFFGVNLQKPFFFLAQKSSFDQIRQSFRSDRQGIQG